MNNHNIYNIIDNNWIAKVTTWISWRYWTINLPISYKDLSPILLKHYNLDIDDFIIKSRKWYFEIDYNEKDGFIIYSDLWNLCIGK